MMNRFHKACRILTSLTILFGLVVVAEVDRPEAYLLPSEQILEFMAARFSKFDTLIVKHSVERESGEGAQNFEEILIMKSPDLLHPKIGDSFGNQNRVVDRGYRRLFFSSTGSRAANLLREAGVDLEKVSYTRVDGTVAYLIGDRGPESPKLAVEKARFLPLFFVYPSSLAGSSELINVTFRDYRQVDQGWYPFEILCSSGKGWAERYEIQSIQANVPVEPSIFMKPQEESRPSESPAKDEKIDAIIKMFEQKYGR
jgi:hypothetical protein